MNFFAFFHKFANYKSAKINERELANYPPYSNRREELVAKVQKSYMLNCAILFFIGGDSLQGTIGGKIVNKIQQDCSYQGEALNVPTAI